VDPRFSMQNPENSKLLWGFLFEMRRFTKKLSPADYSEGVRKIRTNNFTMHVLESASGIIFVLNSDNTVKRDMVRDFSKRFVPFKFRPSFDSLTFLRLLRVPRSCRHLSTFIEPYSSKWSSKILCSNRTKELRTKRSPLKYRNIFNRSRAR